MAYTGGNSGYVRRLGKILGGASAPVGLVAYWHLDEASGVRLDATENGHDLADTGGTGSAAGKIGDCASMLVASGQSLQLTGAETQAMLPLGTSWSMMGWVRLPDGFNGQPYVAGPVHINYNSGGYTERLRVLRYVGGDIYLLVEAGDVTISGLPFTATDWNFIAVTYNHLTETATFMLNDNADVVTASVTPSTDKGVHAGLSIPHLVYNYVNTQVDEVSIWSRALSRAERLEIYNGGAGRVLF